MVFPIIKNNNPIGEYRIGETVILVKNSFTGNFEINNVIQTIKNLPYSILSVADSICIGDFPFLKKRQIEAVYNDRMIYITNKQNSPEQFLKNLIHELAHGCEEQYYNDVYDDHSIKQEFISKRIKMYEILTAYGYDQFKKESYLNPEYEESFDKYLFQTIGYDKLGSLVRGVFLSPYAATSLREYFANGFEKYFLEGDEEINRVCPQLASKLAMFVQKVV
jgi:hypothetical protein